MEEIKCPFCGAKASSGSTHCDVCGTERKYCPQCGNAVMVQQNFCTKCGYSFKSEVKENNDQPSNDQPSNDQPFNGVGTQSSAEPTVAVQAKGKGFAIPAFVLAMVTTFLVFVAIGCLIDIKATQELLHNLSNSQVHYYIVSLEMLYSVVKAVCIISIIAAVVSDVLVVFAYIGHAKNVANGVQSKLVLIFAIIASVMANIFGVIAIVLLDTVHI